MRVQRFAPALLVIASACASAGGGTSSSAPWSVEDLGLPTAATAAAAAKPLRANAEYTGTLADVDPALGDGTRYQVWRLDAAPGRRATVKLSAGDFTPFLVVTSVSGDSLEVVATHRAEQDGAARVSFEAVDRGPFYIFVNAVRREDRGEYALRAGPYEPPMLVVGDVAPSSIQRLQRANTAVSTLGEADHVLHDESRFQLWRFTGKKGERLLLTMASTEFRPYLGYGRMVADTVFIDGQAGTSDEGGEAMLLIELDRDGEHVVVANGAGAGDEGRYTLRLEPRAETRITVAESARQKISVLPMSVPQFATLGSADAVLGDRTHYQLWQFEGKAGEPVMVTMTSSVVDPYVYVGVLENDVVRVLKSNDDRGVGVESRVHVTLPKTGTYVVIANAVSASELGPYRILLERGRGGTRLR